MNVIKKNLALSAIIALLVIGGGVALVNQSLHPSSSDQHNSKKVLGTTVKKALASVSIKADGKETNYSLNNGVGSNALDLTKAATGNKVITTGTGTNAFVTSINGRVASDSKKEYWELLVNGKESQVGAGSYIVKQGDSIIWQIATY